MGWALKFVTAHRSVTDETLFSACWLSFMVLYDFKCSAASNQWLNLVELVCVPSEGKSKLLCSPGPLRAAEQKGVEVCLGFLILML